MCVDVDSKTNPWQKEREQLFHVDVHVVAWGKRLIILCEAREWLFCLGVNSKINPADCVDMDCDALKKALVVDTDGSLLGAPGSVLPNAGFEWDGDPRRGLGDYRIPKVATWQSMKPEYQFNIRADDSNLLQTLKACKQKHYQNQQAFSKQQVEYTKNKNHLWQIFV